MAHVKRQLNCRNCGKDISNKKYKIVYCSTECREEYRVKYKKVWAQNNRRRLTLYMREYRAKKLLEKQRRIRKETKL